MEAKNILVINGLLHGHFTGSVEIVKQLVSMGYNVTCYVLDSFAERLSNVGAKLEILKLDLSDFETKYPEAPKIAINPYRFQKAYDAIFTLFSKEKTKYDYLLIDSFFEYSEMNKIFKFPMSNIITIYTAFCLTDQKVIDYGKKIEFMLKPVSMKYNIDLHDYIRFHYTNQNENPKLILTSQLFHLRGETVGKPFHFIGPSIENRAIDPNFNFKKDSNKKLIFISLGTLHNQNKNFYLLCIESFKNSEKYQVIMSIGSYNNIELLGEIPSNFSVFHYVPQHQVLKMADFFITHGGLNSTQEALLNLMPLIVLPQKFDQFDNAKRVEELGAGIALNNSKLTVEVLQNSINEIDCNREKYINGIKKIVESFEDARHHREEIFKKIFV